MSTKFNGREWQNEELLKQYRENSAKILDCQLALENYEDFNNVLVDKFSNISKNWVDIKKKINTDEQLYEASCNILQNYLAILEEIGREKFIFYKDGLIEYNAK